MRINFSKYQKVKVEYLKYLKSQEILSEPFRDKIGQLNNFYIPLSNPLECFSILKSHADLLTILFCIGVIGSSANSLDTITTGIMSGILMLIIVYKAFKGMKTSI